MPKYFYVCTSCDDKFSFYHGMTEEKRDCTACNQVDVLKKIPSSFFCDVNKENTKKVGEVVKNTIKEIHDELKKQKRGLKEEYCKENE